MLYENNDTVEYLVYPGTKTRWKAKAEKLDLVFETDTWEELVSKTHKAVEQLIVDSISEIGLPLCIAKVNTPYSSLKVQLKLLCNKRLPKKRSRYRRQDCWSKTAYELFPWLKPFSASKKSRWN